MKHNCEYKRLGDVCDFRRGLTYSKNEESQTPTDVAVVRSNNIDLSTYSFITDDLKYLVSNFVVPKDKILVKDSILMCMSNGSSSHIGKVAYIDKDYPYAFGGFMGLILPHDIESKYLYYFFRSQTFKIAVDKLGNGINIANLKFSTLSKLPILVPLKNEQQKIVSELDVINELLAIRKEQLKELDNLAQSLFYDTFGDPITNPKGWKVVKLKDLSTLITNGNTPKGGEKVYVESGIMFLRSQNVWRNCLKMDDVAFIDEETNLSMKGSILHHNDLLITKTGRINTENSSLGRTALFIGEDYTANINGHVYLVRLKENTNPIFVLYILISEQFRELIRKVCVGAIDKRQLNRNHIEDFPIICPPKDLQDRYAKQIEMIENQKAVLNESLKELQTLLDSRMDYWFN